MKSTLSSILSKLPTSRLNEIIAARKIVKRIDARSKKELVLELSKRLSNADSIIAAYEDLSMLEVGILHFAAFHGGLVPRSVLDASIDNVITAHTVDAAIGRLEQLALLFRLNDSAGESMFAPADVLRLVELPKVAEYSLRDLLQYVKSDDLRIMAWLLELATVPGQKDARIELIAGHLSNPDTLKCMLDTFSDEQKAVFEFILDGGNDISYTDLCARFPKVGNFSTYSPLRYTMEHSDEDIFQWLIARGLVFSESEWGCDPKLVVAREIREIIRGPIPWNWNLPGAELKIQTVSGLSFERYDRTVQDFAVFLSYIRHARPKEIQKGGIGKPDIKRAAKWMRLDGGENYVGLLAILAKDCGMMSSKPARGRVCDEAFISFGKRANGRYDLTDNAHKYLAQPASCVKTEMLRAWMDLYKWNDFNPDPIIRESRYGCSRRSELRRKYLCELMLELQPDQAVCANELYKTLVFKWPSLFMGHFDVDETTEGIEESIPIVLCDYLFRLGVTEKASDGAGNLLVRLRSDARDILRGILAGDETVQEVDSESPAYEMKFVVQPNLEVIAGQHIHPLLLLYLCEFSSIDSYQQAVILKITSDSIRGALDAGMTGSQMVEFLDANSASGVPQNIRYTIQESEGKHGQIRLGKAECYLVVKDESLLREIRANGKLEKYIDKFLTENVAVFSECEYKAFLKDLRKTGYMPVDDSEQIASRAKSWTNAIAHPPKMPQKRKSKHALGDDEVGLSWKTIEKEDFRL